MRCLGLSGGYYHDAAACLFVDGGLVAFIEEERLTGRRYAEGALPNHCVAACLEEAGIDLADVDLIALSWNPDYPEPRTRIDPGHSHLDRLLSPQRFGIWNAPVVVIDHQRSHAAAAYRTSGLDDALVVSVDGSGDGRSLAIYHGRDGRLDELESRDITQSLGWFYQRVTTFLHLGHWQNAGKTMALAALGEPRFAFPFLDICPGEGFHFTYPKDILPPAGEPLRAEVRSAFYSQQRDYLWAYFQSLCPAGWQPPRPHFQRDTGERIYAPPSSFACDLAASAQRVVEEALLALIDRHLATRPFTGVCLGGGVMHNCKAVGRIARRLPDHCRLYVSPVSGDSGGAIGAALEAMANAGSSADFAMTHAYWGPGFDDNAVAAVLHRVGAPVETVADPAAVAAELICAGQTVGWFQGRMEVGARALGGRSILALSDRPDLSDHINATVKNRERWRPFSPSVADTDTLARYWHAAGQASPFMAIALDAKDAAAPTAGVRHIDGTSRVQILRPEDNLRYSRLIDAIGQATGIPMVLNTSFNGRDQPIVCTPLDALRTFHSTALDAAVLGNCVMRKGAASPRR